MHFTMYKGVYFWAFFIVQKSSFFSGAEGRKKMKKVLSVCLSVLLLFGVCVNEISAFSESDIDTSYEKVLAYYENNSTVYGLDEIIALGNAGVDLRSYILGTNWDGTSIYNPTQEFSASSVGSLAKHIIAAIFLGDNPKNIEGKDLVTLLETYVKEGSAFSETADADNLVWVLYALECVESDSALIEKVADVLVSYQVSEDTSEGRDNNNGGYNSVWGISMDTVGYVIEALTLTGNEKYQENIAASLAYLDRKQAENGGYDPNDVYGPSLPNTDTQSSVLQGLLVYDLEGVLNGEYDGTTSEVSDYAVKWQNADGSFVNGSYDAHAIDENWNIVLDENGNPTVTWTPETGVVNTISTGSALRMFSTYKNGSFVLNAKKIYKEMNTTVINPEVSKEETKAPNTGDNSGLYANLAMLLVAGYVVSRGLNRRYE